MALTTARLGLPYPERPDTADVPRDVEALAEGIDIAVVGYSGPMSARPAAGVPYRMWIATDKVPSTDPDYITMDTGTTWVQVSFNMGIPDRSINHIKLMLNTITLAEMDSNSVGGAQIIADAVGVGKIAAATVGYRELKPEVKPSQGAVDGAEALRVLMNPNTGIPATGTAAKGIHATQHLGTGPDPLVPTILNRGSMAARPSSGLGVLVGTYYFAYDFRGGTLFRCTGTGWEQVAAAANYSVFGAVLANGSIVSGSGGFTVSHSSSGSDDYTITFTTPFAVKPTVLTSSNLPSGAVIVTCNQFFTSGGLWTAIKIAVRSHGGDYMEGDFSFEAKAPPQ